MCLYVVSKYSYVCFCLQRVNGSLAVSRALGDFEYKNVEGKGPTEQLVSPEPEFFIKVITNFFYRVITDFLLSR